MPNNKVAIENIISMLIYIEKWMNFEIIVGIPLLTKAVILGVQNILEVLLDDIGILEM